MKLFFLVLLSISLLFAAGSAPWAPTVILAILASICILALTYAFAFALEVNELKFLASEELFQVIATMLLVAIIMGAETYFNMLASSTFGQPSIPDVAEVQLKLQLDSMTTAFSNLRGFAVDVGREASKSSF